MLAVSDRRTRLDRPGRRATRRSPTRPFFGRLPGHRTDRAHRHADRTKAGRGLWPIRLEPWRRGRAQRITVLAACKQAFAHATLPRVDALVGRNDQAARPL